MTKEELVNLLKTNIAQFNDYRGKNPNQERWDWRGIDLSVASLKEADLRRIDFTGADFRRADLRDAQFGGSVLQGAAFGGADVTGTNFHHAMMQGADLRGSKFTAHTRMGRICVNLHSFEKVRWDKAHIEEILDVLNQNQDWLIKYQVVPKDSSS